MWAFSYISDNDKSHPTLMKNKLCLKITPMIQKNYKIAIPTIRTIGNLACGSDELVDHILQCDAISNLC